MKSKKLDVCGCEIGKQGRYLLCVDAELLRPAAHAHAGALDLEVRVHSDSHPRTQSHPVAGAHNARNLGRRLDFNDDAGGNSLPDARFVLPRTGEAYVRRAHWRIECRPHFECGGNVESVDERCEVLHDGRHRIGLDRVAQFDLLRQCRPEQLYPVGEQRTVIGKKRCRADPVGQSLERNAADSKLAIDLAKRGYGWSQGQDANSFLSMARSNLPLGDRGISFRMTMADGTM